MKRISFLFGICAALCLQAQPNYTGTNATGQLMLVRTVNLSRQAQFLAVAQGLATEAIFDLEVPPSTAADSLRRLPVRRRRPESLPAGSLFDSAAAASPPFRELSISVNPGFAGFGFNGSTHRDQRQSNNGNQFSIEPPNPSIAVSAGFILEGVNNAVQVYSVKGVPLLPQAVSSNQMFGLAPGIDRTTGVQGPKLTDMRVFYDQGIDRWFVVQRSLDSDASGNPLTTSHLYIAVSQTNDPAGTYNIYAMDTTNGGNRGCPCLPDYPQIGADQYGFYVSANEFNTIFSSFVDATILAISKASLASGARLPSAYQIVVHPSTGYEFTIQPAVTPPGGSYFLANNGLEYFVSSINPLSGSAASSGSNLAVWSLTNTASLATASPSPLLSQTLVPSLTYVAPDVASQRPGPLPYGSTLFPPGRLANIDGGDTRVLSVSYAGGRLYATLGTQVTDDNGHSVVGGAYFVISPTFRGARLSAFTLRQGFLSVNNNHLLRPAIAVNPQGKGAVVFTLVGPDYYPSAAFLPIDTFSTGTAIQIAGPGAGPEDGFTGYPGGFGVGIARWGDYSEAVAGADGSIWMVAEYIPNLPRTQFANWGTFLIQYVF